jgi:hypothetical protein
MGRESDGMCELFILFSLSPLSLFYHQQ